MLGILFRAILFNIFIAGGAITLHIIQIPSLLVWPFSLRLFRLWNILVQRLFGSLLVITAHVMAPFDLVVTGDVDALFDPQDPDIVVMANHQIYTDWWYLWSLAWIGGRHGDLKIIMKEDLKYVPILGWGMQFFEFIFLKRKWSLDRIYLKTSLLASVHDFPMWLIIFPEGTVIANDTQKQSRAYAKKVDLDPKYDPQHTLHPRATGLFHCCGYLRPKVKHLVDITIAFSDYDSTIHPYHIFSPWNIFMKKIQPRRVFVHIKKYSFQEIPGLDGSNWSLHELEQDNPEFIRRSEAFQAWLRDRFLVKDRMLLHYHRTGQLQDIPQDPSICSSAHAPAAPTRRIYSLAPRLSDFFSWGVALVLAAYIVSLGWIVFKLYF